MAALALIVATASACSSSSPSRASIGRSAAQRCAAYQKTHYPTARIVVRATNPDVVCVIKVGPVVTCTYPSGFLSLPKEMLNVALASNGSGRVVRTFRHVCGRGQTMTTQPLPPISN